MAEEIWKPIENFDGDYLISNLGRVYSAPRTVDFGHRSRIINGTVLKPKRHKGGYLCVVLRRKDYFVHRLVAEAFIPNPNGYMEVNHIDEDKTNNSVQNLEWCDRKYNANYGTIRKRQSEARAKSFTVMNEETREVYSSPISAFRSTGIHNDSISRVCKYGGTAGGYHWRYVNEARRRSHSYRDDPGRY